MGPGYSIVLKPAYRTNDLIETMNDEIDRIEPNVLSPAFLSASSLPFTGTEVSPFRQERSGRYDEDNWFLQVH